MIYQAEEEGWLVVTQPAHAWLAGKLAAMWGNEAFAAPAPRESVIVATRLHDIGWAEWDAVPRLGADGQPVNFLETTLAETVPVWRRGVRLVGTINPVAALLVSQHATRIYERRRERGVDAAVDLAELLDEQASVRRQLLAVLGEEWDTAEHLQTTYRWLRACDLLSLAVLSDALPNEGEIGNVPGAHFGEFTTLHYQYQEPFTLLLHPWPFRGTEARLHVAARYLEHKRYPDQTVFHAALAEACWRQLPVTLRYG
ncbi:MAG TPA: DUF3891 family protein [Anaerolineae bacterium]|nr:DUF3891 family protein [Anaerolineae bacterium]